jgi:hypothetical protein
VPSLSVTSLFGGLEQFFTGPPLNTWVTGFALLRALELAGDVAGCLALAALLVNRKRLTAAGADTAAFVGLAVVVGVGVMLLASFYHPLEDGKYLSTAWAPAYALLGAGVATMPWRRVAFGAGGVTAAVAAATVLAITNPETPMALAAFEGQASRGDLVAAYPSEYLLVRYYGDGAIAGDTRSLAVNVPWFWGTAVYPPGAVLHALPRHGSSAVWYVYEPGDPMPNTAGYHIESTSCWTGVCVTMLSLSAGGAAG